MDNPQELRPKPKKRTTAIVIVIVLIVTLSIAAVVMLGRSNDSDNQNHVPPMYAFSSRIPGGFLITLQTDKETPWGDVTILLTDGTNTASWSPLTTELDNGTTAKWNQVTTTPNLGVLKVNIGIVDLAGNGLVHWHDLIALTLGAGQTFSSAATYWVFMVYDPSTAGIQLTEFQG